MQIEFPHNVIIRILSILRPCALSGSRLFSILGISSAEKLTESSGLLVSFAKLSGKTLLLFNRVQYTPHSMTKFDLEVKIRSVQEEYELSMCRFLE